MKGIALFLLAAAVAASGCGSDGGNVGPPPPVNMTGHWVFSIGNLSAPGLGFSCAVSGSMDLTQTAASFDGSYQIGTFRCTNGFQSGPGGGPVVNGTVYAGDSVHFHFDTDDLDQHGVVADSRQRMSGLSTWAIPGDGSGPTLTGSWSAHR